MTACRGIYSPRRAKYGAGEGRNTKFTIRMDNHELAALDGLAARYAAAKGLERVPLKTTLTRIALQRLAKAFPAPKAPKHTPE